MESHQLSVDRDGTPSSYKDHLWPVVSNAVDQILMTQPGQSLRVSFEETYSCIYRIVCQGNGLQLVDDLLKFKIDPYLNSLDVRLQQTQDNTKEYIEMFEFVISRYFLSSQSLASVFIYLTRIEKDTDSLEKLLCERLNNLVIKGHLTNVLEKISDLEGQPFSIEPSICASIVKMLYEVDKGNALTYPVLFKRFIPDLVGRSLKSELPVYSKEAKNMTTRLSKEFPPSVRVVLLVALLGLGSIYGCYECWIACSSSRKRTADVLEESIFPGKMEVDDGSGSGDCT